MTYKKFDLGSDPLPPPLDKRHTLINFIDDLPYFLLKPIRLMYNTYYSADVF